MNHSEPDPSWEKDLYSQGRHLNRYPFDAVVSFIYRWHPRDKLRSDVSIIELGCGAGNNLWFAAREGFSVAGIDGSPSAIEHARQRFAQDGLKGDLRVGDFTELPWPDVSFDLAVDRCSLTCASFSAQQRAIAEVRRVLTPGGLFFYNVYSDRHSSARSGRRLPDGRITEISNGTLVGVGSLYFSTRAEVESLFANAWKILKLEHMELEDLSPKGVGSHSEWRVVARSQ
jgi:SAM-dependent methyltransferase